MSPICARTHTKCLTHKKRRGKRAQRTWETDIFNTLKKEWKEERSGFYAEKQNSGLSNL